jgi:uncharacterized protein YjlB
MEHFDTDDVRTYMLDDDGRIPNNPQFPLLVYPGAIPTGDDPVGHCKSRLGDNGWAGTWVNGVFDYHHYHSNTHEFLGVVGGRAKLALGGPEGVELEVEAGDALVLPAGTGHKRLESSSDFRVVGAYPGGQTYDMNTGDPDERPEVVENIGRVGSPGKDPLFGAQGPLVEIWGRG